jgi:dTDP-glucose 4,6-dehydratase
MRVLVTGGAGFISSHFAKRLLAAGDKVVVLDKLTYAGNESNVPEGAEFHRGDIGVKEDVDAVGDFDAIVNFAAETHVDRSILGPHDFARTDVLGALVLAEVARDRGIRLVQVSTDEVYGEVTAPVRESAELWPSSPYSASKAGGDLQVLAAVETYGIDGCITRGSNTYGPGQYPEKLIPLFVTNALDGELLPLYGDGRQIRDWIHVDDHCAAIEFVLRNGDAGQIYNVGAGNERENIEVARRILELTGADPSLLRLEPLRSLQVLDRVLAVAQLEQRIAEVVVREALVRIRRTRALQAGDSTLQERHGARIVAGAHPRVTLVVERVRAPPRGNRCRRRRGHLLPHRRRRPTRARHRSDDRLHARLRHGRRLVVTARQEVSGKRAADRTEQDERDEGQPPSGRRRRTRHGSGWRDPGRALDVGRDGLRGSRDRRRGA